MSFPKFGGSESDFPQTWESGGTRKQVKQSVSVLQLILMDYLRDQGCSTSLLQKMVYHQRVSALVLPISLTPT